MHTIQVTVSHQHSVVPYRSCKVSQPISFSALKNTGGHLFLYKCENCNSCSSAQKDENVGLTSGAYIYTQPFSLCNCTQKLSIFISVTGLPPVNKLSMSDQIQAGAYGHAAVEGCRSLSSSPFKVCGTAVSLLQSPSSCLSFSQASCVQKRTKDIDDVS